MAGGGRQLLSYLLIYYQELLLTLMRLGVLKVVFSVGVQFDPPSYFKKNWRNVSITLYSC